MCACVDEKCQTVDCHSALRVLIRALCACWYTYIAVFVVVVFLWLNDMCSGKSHMKQNNKCMIFDFDMQSKDSVRCMRANETEKQDQRGVGSLSIHSSTYG